MPPFYFIFLFCPIFVSICYKLIYDYINALQVVTVKNLAAIYNIEEVQKILGKDFFTVKEIIGIKNYKHGLYVNPDAVLIHKKR